MALECMERERPSLILLDLMMPEMDGFEFADEVRQHPEWRSIPIVVVTAAELTRPGAAAAQRLCRDDPSREGHSHEELLQSRCAMLGQQCGARA